MGTTGCASHLLLMHVVVVLVVMLVILHCTLISIVKSEALLNITLTFVMGKVHVLEKDIVLIAIM